METEIDRPVGAQTDAPRPCARCADNPGIEPSASGWTACAACSGTAAAPAFPARQSWQVRNAHTRRTLGITLHAQERWLQLAGTGEAEMAAAVERALPFGAQLTGRRDARGRRTQDGLMLLDEQTNLAFPIKGTAVVSVLTHAHAVANAQAFISVPANVQQAYRTGLRPTGLQLARAPADAKLAKQERPMQTPAQIPEPAGDDRARQWGEAASACLLDRPPSLSDLDVSQLEALQAACVHLRGTATAGCKAANRALYAELGRLVTAAQRALAARRKDNSRAAVLETELEALRAAVTETAGAFLGARIFARARELKATETRGGDGAST